MPTYQSTNDLFRFVIEDAAVNDQGVVKTLMMYRWQTLDRCWVLEMMFPLKIPVAAGSGEQGSGGD